MNDNNVIQFTNKKKDNFKTEKDYFIVTDVQNDRWLEIYSKSIPANGTEIIEIIMKTKTVNDKDHILGSVRISKIKLMELLRKVKPID